MKTNAPLAERLKHLLQYSAQPAVSLILLALLCLAYGLYPGATHLPPGSILHHPSINSFHDVLYNPRAGYPAGTFYFQGLPYAIMVFVWQKLFNTTEYQAGVFIQLILLIAAYAGGIGLLRKLKVEKALAPWISFIYLISPFCIGHYRGYLDLSNSLMLLPLCIFFDLSLFSAGRSRTVAGWGVLAAAARTALIFFNGYGFIFGSTISLIFLLCSLTDKSKKRRSLLAAAMIFAAGNLAAVMLYKAYVPGGADYAAAPLSFFRGMGADLATFFIPYSSLWFKELLGIKIAWNKLAFFGDGSNVAFNYLGYSLLIPALYCLYAGLRKNKDLRPIALAAAMGLVLSLGPSLKIHDTREVAPDEEITFYSYLMEEHQATLSLPTAVLYKKLPGLKNMRGIYRWAVVLQLMILLMLGILYSDLYRKKRFVLLAGLLALNIAEKAPNLPALRKTQKNLFSQSLQYDRDVLQKLASCLKAGEKVLFLSNENAFLVNPMANFLPALIYNLGGDKALNIAVKHRPRIIRRILAKAASNKQSDITSLVKTAMQKRRLDKLIIPYFSLGQNFFYWPPTAEQRDKFKKLLKLIDVDDPFFSAKHSEFFTVIGMRGNTA